MLVWSTNSSFGLFKKLDVTSTISPAHNFIKDKLRRNYSQFIHEKEEQFKEEDQQRKHIDLTDDLFRNIKAILKEDLSNIDIKSTLK